MGWDWEWDETLYAGSATHYSVGRRPYPPELAEAIRDALGLDGTGRLLDLGCGPGSLTLLLAPLFEAAVGVDADAGMLAEAARRSDLPQITWRQARAEQLPADLGTFRVVSFAQSFHWMDQPVVAQRVREVLDPGGAWVHVHADTHQGVTGDDPLSLPRPPWAGIDELVAGYLGPVRRAGRGTLPTGTRSGEESVLRAAGYSLSNRLEVGGGEVVERSTDDIVAAVFSLSSSTPHLFADRMPAFEADLRLLLLKTSPAGYFSERMGEIEVVIWRP